MIEDGIMDKGSGNLKEYAINIEEVAFTNLNR
jgi:hypothetical protein